MTLALIAGRGSLPARVAAAQAEPPLVCVYEGCDPKGLKADLTFRLETLGSLLAHLTAAGINEVCLCGAIDRPQLDPARLDARTAPLVPQFQAALASGDNGALEVIKTIFEEHGLTVVGADALVPGLVVTAGVLSAAQPDDQMRRDAARGAAVLGGLAALDIGQACVIGGEQVYGIEAIGGTDHLLASLPERVRGARAVLCKGPKTGQLREIDLPTIGPDTLRAAHAAGLAGVVVAAEGVIVLEQERCAALADELGLVLWVRGDVA
ncbi:LpxI family protein [Sulfitobacter delicatus]|uniref:Phosphatidate cytidylyltransferase n=1 Tax=Sulfitobacter delicatus TaxID=218672 RepID=A0A1G7SF72_9RHOB|nr:UDP-2,3-diacylglucosamine diphosphatase LpxI [Sulfitobacter delicatus]SDG21564.1 hypothetical protein SAMN04489759_105175 [Sulfitobacter delicatus]